MKRRRFVFCSIAFAVLFSSVDGLADERADKRRTENVLLITIDGLRWQELFGGADESLLNKEFGGVKGEAAVRERFWRETPQQRREVLMPFFWRTIAQQGIVWGDPEDGSAVRVTNPHMFSYPGYNEILTGFADPRIDSNAKKPNPNVTVLEWLHRKEPYRGRVRAYTSWDVFPYIINTERSGIPVNAGWTPLAPDEMTGERKVKTLSKPVMPAQAGIQRQQDKHRTPDSRLRGNDVSLAELDRLAGELPHYWDNVRYDYFTFRGAEESIKQDRPRVLYVAFGETDDWAHAGRYDLYLDAARRTDDYIERLWKTMQSLPQYAGKTSLVITTDHGRGDTLTGWKSHGTKQTGSDEMWIALLSPDVPHASPGDSTVTQSQVAATVAALLGEDYHGAVPKSGRPLGGVVAPSEGQPE